ncbi:MAG TPA: STAS domain-containing protein [Geobacteraceae bacterium]|nr:STAS domain-containing protein [Geobacteraceae bacterium]
MEIQVKKEDKVTIVSVSGKMDAVTAPDYEKRLQELVAAGDKVFINDFSDLVYISSAGLRSILATAKDLKSRNGKLLFAGIKGPVKDVFEISGFGSLFQLHESLDSARNSIG